MPKTDKVAKMAKVPTVPKWPKSAGLGALGAKENMPMKRPGEVEGTKKVKEAKMAKKTKVQSPQKLGPGSGKGKGKGNGHVSADRSLDEFLADWSDDPSSGEEEEEEEEEGTAFDGVSEGEDDEGVAPSRYVAQLKEKDPEFYQFLEENDRDLLEGDGESEDSDVSDAIDEGAGFKHKLPDQLEMASDESDFEDEGEGEKNAASTRPGQVVKVTGSLLASWEKKLESEPNVVTLEKVTQAFEAALKSIVAAGRTDPKDDERKKETGARFVVKGSAAFNAVVRTCLTHLEPALRSVLKVERDARHNKLVKSNKWKPLNKTLKGYTLNVTRLLSAVSDASVLAALLKHIHVMIPYYAALPKSAKHLLSQLIGLWSTFEEASVRILAFLCLIKLTRALQSTMYESIVKQMYLAFVKNAKFTSPSTWPKINFMRRSLAELFALDQRAAYNHAFVYIRQLGISLRTALTAQKKEQIAAVYNWQFVHSLHLWVQLLNQTHPSDVLEPLLYPLVQIITGCIKLVYTLKYWPLRFHLCQMLTSLAQHTDKFIPVLPYYLDILNGHNFNKKVSKVSMKPVDFSCILRISKAQSQENGTFDTAMDHIYRGMLEYLNTQSYKIAFPELVVPATMQVKAFLKKTKMANYAKKMKQMLDKTSENATFILHRRKAVPFNVGDKQRVAAWEAGLRSEASTPLAKLILSWKPNKSAAEEEDKKLELSKEDAEDDGDQMKLMNFIPSLQKLQKKKLQQAKEKKEFKGLLASDDEDEEEELSDNERFQRAQSRSQKEKEERDAANSGSDDEDLDDDSSGEDDDSDAMDVDDASEASDNDLELEDDDVEDEVEELKLEDLETDEEEEDKSFRMEVRAKKGRKL